MASRRSRRLEALALKRNVKPPSKNSSFVDKYGIGQGFVDSSGLTPTSYHHPSFLLLSPSGPGPKGIAKKLRYQRKHLNGFTSLELDNIDCLPTRPLKRRDVKGVIHPMFQAKNWENKKKLEQRTWKRKTFLQIEDYEGEWKWENREVREALKDSLMLASKVLGHIGMLPWFDAFLLGVRKRIKHERINYQDQAKLLKNFWCRDMEVQLTEVERVKEERDKVFKSLVEDYNLEFGFTSRKVDFAGEDPSQKTKGTSTAWAVSQANYEEIGAAMPPRIGIWLSTITTRSLLRDDLGDADERMVKWAIAITLVHELMHAIEYRTIISDEGANGINFTEPYFENEAVSELGASCENAVLGISRPMVSPWNGSDPVPRLPLGFWSEKVFPTFLDAKDSNDPVLSIPTVKDEQEIFPVPNAFYEDIFQDEFWNVGVRKFGLGILRYRGGQEGVRITNGKGKGEIFDRFDDEERIEIMRNDLNDQMEEFSQVRVAKKWSKRERDVIRIGRKFLDSGESEAEFSASFADFKTALVELKNLRIQAKNEGKEGNILELLGVQIWKICGNANKKHRLVVRELLDSERQSEVRYTQRRMALLLWNREMRKFMKTLVEVLGEKVPNALEEEIRLEESRMLLFQPKDLTPQDDFQEMRKLKEAKSARDGEQLDFLADIADREDLSLYGKMKLDLLTFQARIDDLKASEELKLRIINWLKVIETLQNNTEGWEKKLKSLEGNLRVVMSWVNTVI